MKKQHWSTLRAVLAGTAASLALVCVIGAASYVVSETARADSLSAVPAYVFTPADAGSTDGAASFGWLVECVDCPKYFTSMTDRSLRVDTAGHPHIAYGGDHLYYAWHDGSTWYLETVDDAPGVGSYASLALDGSGYPHISYYDDANHDLKYAYRDASGWHILTVDSEGEVGEDTSLAVDGNGYPHIAYVDDTNSDLKYAYRDASGWHKERVADVTYNPRPSLALTGAGSPRISYSDYVGLWIKYAYRSAYGNWLTLNVDAVGTGGGSSSLAVDGDGHPHISYYSGAGFEQLEYAYQDASGWHWETVDSEGRVGTSTSLALDGSGYPRVSYYDGTNADLKYAYQDASGWHTQTVDSGGSVGLYTSLALDGAGLPHISYYDGTNADLKYAYQDASGWHMQAVDSRAEPGWGTSLALDGGDYPLIGYFDWTNGDLEYAYQDASGWHIQTVDSEGSVGRYPSLALDGGGYPHISYLDGTNTDLKYAYSDASGWHTETVGLQGTVDGHTSLALGGDVTLSIDDPETSDEVDYSATQTPAPQYWNPLFGFATFELGDAFTLQPGFGVTMTDGAVTKTHTVAVLQIAGVDMATDQVYGVAAAGSELVVVARSETVRAQRNLVSVQDGSWLAEFSVPGPMPWEQDTIQLETAYIIFAYQSDDDSDRTWVHWVENHPPEIGAIAGPADPVAVNTEVQVSASFNDPDADDTHTAVWDWGDGTTSGGIVAEEDGMVSGSHTYTAAGVYALQLTVCDAASECDLAQYQYLVVYDPAGGFVTGGGWIWSAQGYCHLNAVCEAAEGKASFGFVSKYKRGASVPEGNTEFQFRAGDLNFHSSSYQWLVVNQNYTNAQFKGYGTINGTGRYGFMIWAGDSNPDTFRIKIWVADDETNVVYDNGVAQPIGGGSIVIHK